MAWIKTEDVGVPGIIGTMPINPTMMEAVQKLNRSVSFGSSALTRVQEESIATTVSVVAMASSGWGVSTEAIRATPSRAANTL